MMIEPLASASASAKSAESRSGAKTLVSLTFASLRGLDLGDRVHRRDRERVVDDAVDAAERLEGLVAQVDPRVLVGHVGDDADDLDAVALELGLELEEPGLGAAGDHQVGAHLGGLLGQRPAEAGADAGDDDDLALQQRVRRCSAPRSRCRGRRRSRARCSTDHPSGNGALPGGDPRGVLLGGEGGEVREPCRVRRRADHLDDRPVLGAEVAGRGAASAASSRRCGGRWSPASWRSGAAGWRLGDHEPHLAVGVGDGLGLGERGLVGLVVGRGVPVRADLDALVGAVGALGHGDDQRLVVGQLVVADRGALRGQPAGRRLRRGRRVDRLLVLEELREGEPGLDRADQRSARRPRSFLRQPLLASAASPAGRWCRAARS